MIGAGAFVRFGGELGDVYEGFLPARRLRGECFELNETETALVGRRSGRALRLGDPVSVRVDWVEAPRGRVDLVAAGEPTTVESIGAESRRERPDGKKRSASRPPATSPPTAGPATSIELLETVRGGDRAARAPRSSRCATARRSSTTPTR